MSKKENDIVTKEEEIIDSYQEEEYEDFKIDKTPKERRFSLVKRLLNVLFIILIISFILIATDVIAVARYNVGPFFAIPGAKYKDGGTREYYGLGYKVIKYNQVQGRRDMEIGLWSLKYNTTPITIQDVDLAIETQEEGYATYEKYYKKFVRVISNLQKVEEKKKQITLGYVDEGGKYSIDIICNMVEEQDNLEELETGKEITIIGTLVEYKEGTKKKNPTYIIENCFAEQ